ncbi:hypothetical protein L3X38_034814 [Prunus dulcis]|uniref:Uncharacterized protein n=1 Tax=Prunus dulcis TaxID=3755 RepID=A0AAD4VIG9_PRUDU|nr:hypothetical protein L3X38_034814 [Prunus dulcis]
MLVVSGPWDADYLVLTANARLVNLMKLKIEHELQKIDVIAQVRCWLTAEVRLLCTDQLFCLWYVSTSEIFVDSGN